MSRGEGGGLLNCLDKRTLAVKSMSSRPAAHIPTPAQTIQRPEAGVAFWRWREREAGARRGPCSSVKSKSDMMTAPGEDQEPAVQEPSWEGRFVFRRISSARSSYCGRCSLIIIRNKL